MTDGVCGREKRGSYLCLLSLGCCGLRRLRLGLLQLGDLLRRHRDGLLCRGGLILSFPLHGLLVGIAVLFLAAVLFLTAVLVLSTVLLGTVLVLGGVAVPVGRVSVRVSVLLFLLFTILLFCAVLAVGLLGLVGLGGGGIAVLDLLGGLLDDGSVLLGSLFHDLGSLLGDGGFSGLRSHFC